MSDSIPYHKIFEKMELADVIAAFLLERKTKGLTRGTLKYYADEIGRFSEYAGAIKFEDITPDLIRRFLEHMASTRNKGGVHSTFRPLRALFLWYEDEMEPDGWRNPIRKIHIPSPRPVALPGITMEDFIKLVSVCREGKTAQRDRAMLFCLLDTCARAEELINLDVQDVNLLTGDVLIRAGKGNKPRYVQIGQRTRKELRKYLKTRADLQYDSPLFEMATGERFSYNSLVSLVRWRSGQARIERPGLHDIRRAGALELLRNGADISTISRYLGHESIVVTMRYLALTPDDLREMHRKAGPVDHM